MSSLASGLATAATVERAAAGDEVAFARIVATHRAEMVRVAYVVANRQAATGRPTGSTGTWEGTTLPWDASPLSLVSDGRVVSGLTPAHWIVWDGNRWVVEEALKLPIGDADFATGPRGVIVVGPAVAAIARDGQHFVTVARPGGEGDSFGQVLATADGFVALDDGREPIPQFSADGIAWEPASTMSPFDEGTSIEGRTPGMVWEEPPAVPTVEDRQPYRDVLDQVYDEIWKLRAGRPVVLRAHDAYNGAIAPWREVGIEPECTANWEVQMQVVREAAEANGAEFVSFFDVFNGPGHDEDPREKGWIQDDGWHANAAGGSVAAAALAAVGFELSEPPR